MSNGEAETGAGTRGQQKGRDEQCPAHIIDCDLSGVTQLQIVRGAVYFPNGQGRIAVVPFNLLIGVRQGLNGYPTTYSPDGVMERA